jgi:hypothetical protein
LGQARELYLDAFFPIHLLMLAEDKKKKEVLAFCRTANNADKCQDVYSHTKALKDLGG